MSRIKREALLGGVSMIVSALFGVQAVCAQSATVPSPEVSSAPQLGEVVVTARRRVERLQDVPVAVAAISKVQLQNNNATDLAKVGELAPQVIIGRQNQGNGAVIGIRGISSSASDTGLDQSVSVAIDGVQLSRGRVISTSVFDLQQVEVLEGPQALFFGKNSPAGVISLTSTDPTRELEGYIKGGYEFVAKERYIEAAIGGPLTDTLRARLAVRLSGMDGWIQNVAVPTSDPIHPGVMLPGNTFGSSQPSGHDYAARLTLDWTPTSDFEAKLKVTPGASTSNSGSGYAEPYCGDGATNPLFLGLIPLTQSDCKKNMVKAESADAAVYSVNYPYGNNGKPYLETNYILGALALNEKVDDVTLSSITGYYYQDFSQATPADYSEITEIFDAQHEVYNLVTQELRASSDFVGPINFTVGLYYEHSKRNYFNAPDVFHQGFNAAANNYTSVEENANSTAESYSAFGELRWKIISSLELAGGARYTSDVKDQTAVNQAVGLGFDFYPQGVPLSSHYTSTNVSPQVTLTWHPKADQTLYGAYKTGYKPGGISNGSLLLANATPENLQFGSETAKGFEIGYKGEFFQHRLRLDLTGYRYNYDGLQVVSFQPQTISFTVGNAAAARTEGVEGSLEWLATDALTFNGSLGYNHARYTDYTTAQCYAGEPDGTAAGPGVCFGGVQDLTGKALVRAPDLSLMLGADYKAHLPWGWIADLSGSGAYTSSYNAAEDNSPGGYQGSYWLLNAALHVGPADGKYDFAIVGRNLTNSYYLVSEDGWPGMATNDYIGVFSRPREVVVQVQYRF